MYFFDFQFVKFGDLGLVDVTFFLTNKFQKKVFILGHETYLSTYIYIYIYIYMYDHYFWVTPYLREHNKEDVTCWKTISMSSTDNGLFF